MALLTRDAILRAEDLLREKVEVPEWGGEVWVRAMTAAERDRLEAAVLDGKTASIRALVAAMCMVDERGERLFGDQDVEALARKNAQALDRVFQVARRLSRMREADVEDAEKN